MKLFSWSNLFLVLSLSFLWGCGYWIWWQTELNQQHRTQEQLSIQLERAEVALSDWQHSHQLHLEYLQQDLQQLSLQQDNPLYDPKLELDDKIQRTRWSDPLLGYAVLDDAGRAMLLSNARAGQLYPLTTVDFIQPQPFLTPLVTSRQWIAPVKLHLSGQHLVLWFDLSALLQRLRQLTGAQGDLLLVADNAELLSPSRAQSVLLQRFGMAEQADDLILRWSLKRPPEDLTRSRQRYDSGTAWPPTKLASLLQGQRQGMTPLYTINYLGKPSVAAFRWLSGWQAFVVAELDLVQAQQERQQLRQYLLAGLGGITGLLLLIFWWLQRLAGRQETELDLPAAAPTPQPAPSLLASANVAASSSGSEQLALQSAASVMQALLQGQLSAAELQMVSREWLNQHRQPEFQLVADQSVLVALPELLSTLLQDLQSQHSQALTLELSQDLQTWYWLPWPLLCVCLQQLLSSRLRQQDVGLLEVRLLVASSGLLRLELCDDGQSLSSAQWQQWLQSASNWPVLQAKGVVAEPVSAQFNGNKTVFMLPVQPQATSTELPELQFVDATALFLCPAGPVQQCYSRQLRQCGLNLLPLDDAAQFVHWCNEHPQQQLDYLILDDSVIRREPALMAQVSAIVRRYFPAVTQLLLAANPATWQPLSAELALRVVAKPLTKSSLMQALQADSGGIFATPAVLVHVYCDQPLQGVFLQQVLLSLGYRPLLHDLQQSDFSAGALCLLPVSVSVPTTSAAVLYYSQQEVEYTGSHDLWVFANGPAALSEHLFNLQHKKFIE